MLDKHAPLKIKKVSGHKKIPWFSNRVSYVIRQRKKAECIWLGDQNNLQKFRVFYQIRSAVANIVHQAECEYFMNTLLKYKHQPREIFRICYRLLGRNQDIPLPPGYTDELLAAMFNNFFINKISKIREVLELTVRDTIETSDSCTHIPPKLATFKVLTCQDMWKIIGRSPSKSGEADPIPTTLVK